jgi:tRNA dimethylallyltransferase
MPKTDRNIEQELQKGFDEHGIIWLQNLVQQEDPEFYAVAELHNPARLMRALAFKRTTGKSIVHFRSGIAKQRPFNIIKIALDLPRTVLYERINLRAAGLYSQRDLKNLQTVGYTEIFECLDGNISKEKSIELIKQHSRNYAKRQLTWFRKDVQYQWFPPTDTDAIIQYLSEKIG